MIHTRGIVSISVLMLMLTPALTTVAAESMTPTLTNFQQVISLGLTGAQEATYPVRVRGVVAYPTRGAREMLHIYDGTNGLGVTLLTVPGWQALSSPMPQVGEFVEVTGETSAGSSHPYIVRATVQRLGPGRFDDPLPIRARDLGAGRHHGAMVRLSAVVLDLSRVRGRVLYLLQADGHVFYAEVGEAADRLPVERLNATVELQGMPWTQFDSAGRVTSFRLLAGSNVWVRVLQPGSSNLFAATRQSIASVSNAPLGDDRFVVSGVVSYAWPNHLVTFEDATGAAIAYPFQPIARSSREGEYVPRPAPPILRAGDRIELVGSKVNHRAYSPVLNNVEYRVTGRVELPVPPSITGQEALTGQHDCRRVRLSGRVLDRDAYEQAGARVSRLWVKFGEQTSYAVFVGSNHVKFAAPAGSRVELTGVCVVSAGTEQPVRALTIYLDSPDDVRLLPEPPVWTSAAVLRVGGVAGSVLALALGWVWLLRRQVARRTAELAASEERFHKAFRNSPGNLAILSHPEGRYLDVNDAFLNLFGFTREEVIGRTSLELGLWQNPAQREEAYRRYEKNGGLRDFESQLRTRSGDTKVVLQSGEFITIGPRRCILSVGIDITDRKRAEGDLRRTLEQERELNQLKTNFVSTVSHEFRTPLEVIVSSADILDRYLDRLGPEERAQHLASIQGSVKRMSAMMEDVLLLGRFEAERFRCQPDDLHLASWSRRFVDEMRSATGGRAVLELLLDEFEPMVCADEKLLRHILANLVSNAVKYSAPGATVRLHIGREGMHAVFRVEDRGCGIPAADQGRVFEAFHRGRNVHQMPGTGLGLVIVKRAVEVHRGQISFASTEGQGTTFTVRLPLFAEAEATDRNPP